MSRAKILQLVRSGTAADMAMVEAQIKLSVRLNKQWHPEMPAALLWPVKHWPRGLARWTCQITGRKLAVIKTVEDMLILAKRLK
jgi:hypothetical protein